MAHSQDGGVSYGQRGQVMAFIAVTLAIVLMPVAAYAIDAASVSAAAAALQEATSTAALEAAQQLDTREFRAAGAMTVDASAARRVAGEVLAADAPAAALIAVVVNGAEVTVDAHEVVELPFAFFPERVVQLEARASARLAAGYDRPSSRMPLPTNSF
jgi:Flp pilus assembly protein TadG